MKNIIIIATIFASCIYGMEIEQPHMKCLPEVFKDLPRGVCRYLEDLPKIAPVDTDDPVCKSKIITDYLLDVGGYDNKNIDGRDVIQNKIHQCILQNRPIMRCIPGFPVSSANRDKLPFDDAHCFSMGDLVGLLTCNHISSEIAKVHKPGSCVAIYWEPFIHDMNAICIDKLKYPQFSMQRIKTYQDTLKQMIGLLAPHVQCGNPDSETIAKLYCDKYAALPIELDSNEIKFYEAFLREDLDTNILMEQSERILFEQHRPELEKKYEQIKGKSFDDIWKNSQCSSLCRKIKTTLGARKYLHGVATDLAQCAYQGSRRMAKLMENEIPAYDTQIRESIRPDKNSVRKKIGTPVIYGAEGTPWHKVLVINASGITLASYKDIAKKKEPKVAYCSIGGRELGFIDNQEN
jgi:hypothetical protein